MMRKILQSALLIFALSAIAYSIWSRGNDDSEQLTSATPATTEPAPHAQVLVTYFTTDVRCTSCLKIEALTQAAVEESFATELASGRVRFQTLNLDRPENEHFASDYDIAFKTVVVSEEKSGEVLRWEKRDDVWKLLDESDAFKVYIAAPVREFLVPQS